MTINSYYKPSFGSYNKMNPETKLSVSSYFYDDYPVLLKSTEIIESTFPKGANILVYAGSNGEEALSLDSLLKQPQKYQIYSIDPFEEAINYANKGVYGVHPIAPDGFLIENGPDINENTLKLKKSFLKKFKEVSPPEKETNLTDLAYNFYFDNERLHHQKFFSPIDKRVKFIKGDINDIGTFPIKSQNKKVGAVFFRNALYHITQNDLNGVLNCGDAPKENIDRMGILRNLFKKVYNKLDNGGIFVLGTHAQEHFYLADKYTPKEFTTIWDKDRNIRLHSQPRHIFALKEIGFKPIFEYNVESIASKIKLKLPLIWQKIS